VGDLPIEFSLNATNDFAVAHARDQK
jgi:hypothetical protein